MKKTEELNLDLFVVGLLGIRSGLVGGLVGGGVGGLLHAASWPLRDFMDPSSYSEGRFAIIERIMAGKGGEVIAAILLVMALGLLVGAGFGTITGTIGGFVIGIGIAIIGKQLEWIEIGALLGLSVGMITILVIVALQVQDFSFSDFGVGLELALFFANGAIGGIAGGIVGGKVFKRLVTRTANKVS